MKDINLEVWFNCHVQSSVIWNNSFRKCKLHWCPWSQSLVYIYINTLFYKCNCTVFWWNLYFYNSSFIYRTVRQRIYLHISIKWAHTHQKNKKCHEKSHDLHFPVHKFGSTMEKLHSFFLLSGLNYVSWLESISEKSDQIKTYLCHTLENSSNQK